MKTSLSINFAKKYEFKSNEAIQGYGNKSTTFQLTENMFISGGKNLFHLSKLQLSLLIKPSQTYK